MEYHKIVLIHRIVVSLFLLHYVVKGYFLISDKPDTLAGYVAKTKIAEMILSVLFLGTGIYLAVTGPTLSTIQIIKISCVVASIPLAIIGFKRGNKALAMLSILLLLSAYGLAEMNKAANKKVDPNASAQQVFNEKCARCHGAGGDELKEGAKNLKLTQMNDEQLKVIIKDGKPGTQMSGFNTLTDEQLNGLVSYIKSLKQ